MKRILSISIIQLLMSVISAMLLAQMSWVSKIGIFLFYKNYAILKSPLKTGAIIFAAQLLIILILHLTYNVTSRKVTRTVSIIIFLLALLGLAYTAYSFNKDFSYRMLKTKFHYGGYLVWVGFMITAIYYFFQPNRTPLTEVEFVETEE